MQVRVGERGIDSVPTPQGTLSTGSRSHLVHGPRPLKAWMGSTHFLTKIRDRVSTEMSLHVLAYSMKRMMNMFGTKSLIEAIGA